MRGRILTLVCLATLVAAAPAHAQSGDDDEGDFDRIDRADELMNEAQAAAEAGDWDKAKELAETVLTLDDSYATGEARLILVRALERLESYDAALYELRQYLTFALTNEERLAAERLGARIEAKRDGTYVRPRRPLPVTKRAGIGLVIGGAVPLVLGTTFIGNDAFWRSQGVPSGTWSVIGTPLLITGLALDVVGIILLVRPEKIVSAEAIGLAPRRRPRLHFGLAPSPEGVALSLGATW